MKLGFVRIKGFLPNAQTNLPPSVHEVLNRWKGSQGHGGRHSEGECRCQRPRLHLLANDEWADWLHGAPHDDAFGIAEACAQHPPNVSRTLRDYSNPCSLRNTPEPFKATSGDRKHGSSLKKVDFKQINGTSLWRRPKSWCETWTESSSSSQSLGSSHFARDRVEFAPNSPPCPT